MIWGRSPVFEPETLNACPWPLAVSAGSHLGDIGSHGEPSHTHFMGLDGWFLQFWPCVFPVRAWETVQPLDDSRPVLTSFPCVHEKP
jgi:hypothetical protein